MIIDRLWRLYGTINEWVRFADGKAGIALGAHAAIFTVAIPQIIQNKAYFVEQPIVSSIIVISTVFALVSAFYGVRCVIPRLNIGEARSLIFFAHIAEGYSDSDSFRAHALGHYNDEEGFAKQVLDQIWANARVAWRKHKDSAYCLRWFVAEAAVSVFGFVFALFN